MVTWKIVYCVQNRISICFSLAGFISVQGKSGRYRYYLVNFWVNSIELVMPRIDEILIISHVLSQIQIMANKIHTMFCVDSICGMTVVGYSLRPWCHRLSQRKMRSY